LETILLFIAGALIREDFNGQFGAAKEWDAGAMMRRGDGAAILLARAHGIAMRAVWAGDCSEAAKNAFELSVVIRSAEWG
jgi:hypothetical protein